MKAVSIKITVQRTDNSTAEKLWIGADFTLDEGENLQDAYKAGRAQIDACFEPPKAEKLKATDADVALMAKRKGLSLEKILQAYDLTSEQIEILKK